MLLLKPVTGHLCSWRGFPDTPFCHHQLLFTALPHGSSLWIAIIFLYAKVHWEQYNALSSLSLQEQAWCLLEEWVSKSENKLVESLWSFPSSSDYILVGEFMILGKRLFLSWPHIKQTVPKINSKAEGEAKSECKGLYLKLRLQRSFIVPLLKKNFF